MAHKIKAVETKDNLLIVATFFDGTVKEYDVKNMLAIYPPLEELRNNKKIFDGIQIDTGGCGVSWNDDLDLDAETIWEEGKEIGKEVPALIESLAAKLTEARTQAGITQKQLAEITGIYQADISKIERGIGNPSLSTLQRLADGMGMGLNIAFTSLRKEGDSCNGNLPVPVSANFFEQKHVYEPHFREKHTCFCERHRISFHEDDSD